MPASRTCAFPAWCDSGNSGRRRIAGRWLAPLRRRAGHHVAAGVPAAIAVIFGAGAAISPAAAAAPMSGGPFRRGWYGENILISLLSRCARTVGEPASLFHRWSHDRFVVDHCARTRAPTFAGACPAQTRRCEVPDYTRRRFRRRALDRLLCLLAWCCADRQLGVLA